MASYAHFDVGRLPAAAASGPVFKLAPSGAEAVLYSFMGIDGAAPRTDLIMDTAENLCGGAGGAAVPEGVVFKLEQSGAETVLYNFTGYAAGAFRIAVLFVTLCGNPYGTTSIGTRSPGPM
jgi:hypothetical protein